MRILTIKEMENVVGGSGGRPAAKHRSHGPKAGGSNHVSSNKCGSGGGGSSGGGCVTTPPPSPVL